MGFFHDARFALSALGACVLWGHASAQAQDQFVVVDATYTATAQNTMDSHYRVDPKAGTPSNWRSPIDYASGEAYVRLQVLEKPSDESTLYNICFEATPSYACMPYSPAYTAPGIYEFNYPFSSFYQYDQVDWSKGTKDIALILKDKDQNKPQGSPDFYPTKVHVTITIVRQGGVYTPPGTASEDAGTDAGSFMDASAPSSDASVSEPDAATMQPATPPAMTPVIDAGSHSAMVTVDAGHMVAAPAETMPRMPLGAAGQAPAPMPEAASTAAHSAEAGGCSATDARAAAGLWSLAIALAVLLGRRASARHRPRNRGNLDG
jgi:hypothetical protein